MNIAQECMRAAAFAAEGSLDLAATIYREILEYQPDHLDAQVGIAGLVLHMGHMSVAGRMIQRIMQQYPEAPQGFMLWSLLREKTDLKSAIPLMNEAVQRAPDNPTPLFHLARMLYQHSKHTQQPLYLAMEKVSQAYLLAPREPTILHLRAVINHEMGYVRQATNDFREALRYDPRHLPSYLGLIDLMLQQDRMTEALRLLQSAYEQCGTHPALASREIGYHTLQGEWSAAAQSARQLATLMPEVSQAQMQLGITSLMNGDTETAETALLKTHDLDPKNWEPLFLLGQLYKQISNVAQAVHCLWESHLRAPERWQPLNELGLVHLQTGDYEEALSYFSLAMQCAPDQLVPLFNVALSHFKNQNYASSRTICKHLLQRSDLPDSTEEAARRLLTQLEERLHPEASSSPEETSSSELSPEPTTEYIVEPFQVPAEQQLSFQVPPTSPEQKVSFQAPPTTPEQRITFEVPPTTPSVDELETRNGKET